MSQTTTDPGAAERDVGDAIRAVGSHFRRFPETARITDSAASATLSGGLRCRVTGPQGWGLETDMHPRFGGEGTAALPSWVLRGAIASCTATTIAMRAAELDVALSELVVEVDSDTDLRGMLGIGGDASAGPLAVRIRVSIEGEASAECLEEIVQWGGSHSPVAVAVADAIEVAVG